ncbi:MAG: hypothetical protein M1827_006556 [Pycnora praestabilis]|nr:MAG: hypothetical protein M1827_006556 [Pycnora praestabilis]
MDPESIGSIVMTLADPLFSLQQTFPPCLLILMASSEVDQKFLGQFAKFVRDENPLLSSMLYKILGLSAILAKKLVRARRLRKLDVTRDSKSLQLYHHIIWLSREGLVIMEQYVLPMVANYKELRVLSHKLKASFYHIFVLFHNQPSVSQTSIPGIPAENGALIGGPKGKARGRDSRGITPPMQTSFEGGPVGGGPLPPGLTPISVPKPTGSFLLPAIDYIPTTSSSFDEAAQLADRLLPGSHPIRLSVKLEYAAYMYDCLRDGDGSRRLAKQTIAEVYNAQEGMDDDTFEDAAELVGILGKMMKRGLGSTPGSTPGVGSLSTPRTTSTSRRSARATPAMPSPSMDNPI